MHAHAHTRDKKELKNGKKRDEKSVRLRRTRKEKEKKELKKGALTKAGFRPG
ncbi:hypothetical protein [Pseudomonas syringae]|uniref:hypothetical protein n=1 Tax=Pseudomonas syringae TaxID=317 RepID=UPI001F20AA05|nr:hypothetical protein [Pseudomonas syringae]MCF5423826.1 hypothetical protein [Pseudomonas syringae]